MNTINKQLKVLLIEDSEIDALLTIRYLKQHWAEVNHLTVENIVQLTEALKSDWDIILSDFNLPGFDGMTALKIVKESGIQIPFILLSGEVSEDVAALMMRLGANDYVMKDNFSRLAPAILRVLKHHKVPSNDNPPKQHTALNKLLPPIIPSAEQITERHKGIINMLVVAEYIRKHQTAVLEKQNLTFPRLNILRILKRVFPESITLTNIREEMIYKTIDLSRMIDKMNREGFVNTIKNKTTKEVAITPKGLEVLNSTDKYYEEMFLPENYLSEENAGKINEALKETLVAIK